MCTLRRKFSEKGNEKVIVRFFSTRPSMSRRVMKMEVNSEVTIPMQRVTAKPCTAPLPNMMSTKPSRKVVT